MNFSGTNRKYENGVSELNACLHEGLLCKWHPRNLLIVICMTVVNVTGVQPRELPSPRVTRLLDVRAWWRRVKEGALLIWIESFFLTVLPSEFLC